MNAKPGITEGKPLPFDTYARFAVGVAYQAALRWQHPQVVAGHLLFGLAQAAPELFPDGSAKVILRSARARIESTGFEPGRGIRPLRYSDDVDAIFARARLASFSAGGQAVGPAHLVPALRAQNDRACSSLLMVSGESQAPLTGPVDADQEKAGPLGWIELSDTAPAPYSQQLADQLRDAVATGKLLPGQRLPALRRLAETLDLAPGTVAKAYRALDSEGIIETAGSKGTTVSLRGPDDTRVPARLDALAQLLRPVAIAAFHMGGSYSELEDALRRSIEGVFPPPN